MLSVLALLAGLVSLAHGQSTVNPTAKIWKPGDVGKIHFDDSHFESIYKPPQHVLDDLNSDRGALEAVLRALGLTWRKSVDNVCEFSLYVHCLKEANGGYLFNASSSGASGRVPAEFAQLKFVVSIDLSHNDFDGAVPEVFWRMHRLTEVRLNNNRFTKASSDVDFLNSSVQVGQLRGGDLIHDSAGLGSFRSDGMVQNETVENEFNIMSSSLRLFDISNNKIRGEFPEHWLRATVIATGNEFYGRFPAGADRFGNLKVDLAGNLVERPDLSLWMASCKNISVQTVSAETLGQMTNRRRASAAGSSYLGYEGNFGEVSVNTATAAVVDKFACGCDNCRGMLVLEQMDFVPHGQCLMNVSLRCSCGKGFTMSPTWSALESRNRGSCEKCPRGLECAGGATPGVVSSGFVMLAGGYIQQCPLPQACAGNNQCVEGSSGTHCAECSSGYLNPLVGEEGEKVCLECDASAYYSLLGYVAAFAGLFVLWYRGSILAPPTSEGFLASWHTLQAVAAISLLRQAPQRDGWLKMFMMSAPPAECLFRNGHLTGPAVLPFAGIFLAVIFCARHVSYGTLTLQPWPRFTRKAGKALKLWPLAAAQVWCYCTAAHVVFSVFRMFDCTSGSLPQSFDYASYRNQFGTIGLYHNSVLRAAPSVMCWSTAHSQFFPLVLLSVAYLGVCLWVATFRWNEVTKVTENAKGDKIVEVVRTAVGKGAVLAPIRMLILCLAVSFAGDDWPFVLLSSLGALVYVSQPFRIEYLASCALCAVAALGLIERLWHHGMSSLFSGVLLAIPILLLEAGVVYALHHSGDKVLDMMNKFLGYRRSILGMTDPTPAGCEDHDFVADMPRPGQNSSAGGSSSSAPDSVQLSVMPEEKTLDQSEEGLKAEPTKLEVTEKRLRDMTKNAQEMRDERDALVHVVHKLRAQVKEMSLQIQAGGESNVGSVDSSLRPARPPPRRSETAPTAPPPPPMGNLRHRSSTHTAISSAVDSI